MADPADDRNAQFWRYLWRLIAIVVVSVIGMLLLIYYLWEHSPKPP